MYLFCIGLDLYHCSVFLLTEFSCILRSHSYFSQAYMKEERFKQYEKVNVSQTYVASTGYRNFLNYFCSYFANILISFAAEKRKTGYRLFSVTVFYEPYNLPCVIFVK